MAYDNILYEVQAGVATITLNRPEKLNSFTFPMVREINEALQTAEKDPAVRCVVFTGAGRGFCAGQDLKAFTESSESDPVRKYYIPLILRIRSIEKPVVAAVNGVAAGAGCSLALACDLVILSTNASLVQAFIKAGLVLDCGAAYVLPRLVGYHKAMELALFGNKVSAGQALELGLCNRVVPEAEFANVVSEWSSRLAAGPKAMGWVKRLVNRGLDQSLEEILEAEASYQELAAETADAKEAMAAFLEKRTPKFTNK